MTPESSGIDNMAPNTGEATSTETTLTPEVESSNAPQPSGSYTKLAMRNMVRKPKRSIIEFGLTVVGLLALLIGLSYLTR